MADFFQDPNLNVALALCIGIMMQSLASHLKLPGIVLLLAAGVLLGPDVANVIHPQTLGEGLSSAVGFAVAVILFEGGMNLQPQKLLHESGPIRRLITVGAVITYVLSTLSARLFMAWDWSLCILFGSLVVVTGPTVVNPLLRRLKVEKEVSETLEAEGVLIDPVGAIAAYITLELVLHPTQEAIFLSLPDLLFRLFVGSLFGVVGGGLLSLILKSERMIPESLTNVFTLSWVLAVYYISDGVFHESGIAATTVAGITVRALKTPVEHELLEFKEQLTMLLIGMLFVLLAADVRMVDIQALGWPGVFTVLALMLIVRPVEVFLSTWGTELNTKQKLFMSWMGPRGIVAAAVASLFAVELREAGLPGGEALRALVFLVIAVTVVTAGLTGGFVAKYLNLKRPADDGWVIAGADSIGQILGKVLKAAGESVVLVDINPEHVAEARAQGLEAMHTNALKESTFEHVAIDTRAGAIGATQNEEVNLLFCQKSKKEGQLRRLFSAVKNVEFGVTQKMVHESGAQVLFGGGHDFELWTDLLAHGQAQVEHWRLAGNQVVVGADLQTEGKVLPLIVFSGGQVSPVGDQTRFRRRDEVVFLMANRHEAEVEEVLRSKGWRPVEEPLTEEIPLSAVLGTDDTVS